jgi:glutaredoxin
MKKVIMYSTNRCGFCIKAKELLESMGVQYEDRPIGPRYTKTDMIEHCTNINSVAMADTVPQMILCLDGTERYIGGYSDLIRVKHTL